MLLALLWISYPFSLGDCKGKPQIIVYKVLYRGCPQGGVAPSRIWHLLEAPFGYAASIELWFGLKPTSGLLVLGLLGWG